MPHRYPFLLIDRVLELEVGKSLVALKNVSFNEPFFMGHFPDRPVMPGVLILEALAQATCVLAIKSSSEDPKSKLYLFAGIDNAAISGTGRHAIRGSHLLSLEPCPKDLVRISCSAGTDFA